MNPVNMIKQYMMKGFTPQGILDKLNVNNPILNNVISMSLSITESFIITPFGTIYICFFLFISQKKNPSLFTKFNYFAIQKRIILS